MAIRVAPAVLQDASPCALPPPALTRQAADNSENCRRLLAFVKHCTRDLARVASAAKRLPLEKRLAGGELQARMDELTCCLLTASKALRIDWHTAGGALVSRRVGCLQPWFPLRGLEQERS